MRAGALPVPLIMAFAQAIELAIARQQKTQEHFKILQEHLIGGLNKLEIPILYNSSFGELQSSAIVNFSFPPVEAEVMVHHLEEKEIFCRYGECLQCPFQRTFKDFNGNGFN